MNNLLIFNLAVSIFFTLCYSYQFFYIFISLIKKPKQFPDAPAHRFAMIISARNEENVVGQLIKSMKNQKYPSDMIDVFVCADNCTDTTAEVARKAGAIVYERKNTQKIGKGYALRFLFNEIFKLRGKYFYDAYMIFDADNLLSENYVAEMNKTFSAGYRVITSYRNTKNYDTNWISAGYSLWFMREAKSLNNSRMILNTSCAVSGTGFLVHRDIINENNGWKHFLLTEDIEFTMDTVIHGEKIGYCHNAMFYDEQPESFSQSWNQRLRWAKGFFQVFGKYGKGLASGVFSKNGFSCYDMTMTIMPAIFLTILSIVLNLIMIIIAIFYDTTYLAEMFRSLCQTCLFAYSLLFVIGTITTITERANIRCSRAKKIKYMFTFPIFMLTYIPIAVVAIFKKVNWQHINHSVPISIEEIEYDKDRK